MAYDHIKTPLNLGLNEWATRRIYEAIRSGGTALPCTIKTPMGPLVEVNFDVSGIFTLPNLIVPVSTAIYSQVPFQKGDMGEVFPSMVSTASVTGIGSGAANLSGTVGWMSALTFFPVGNKGWSAYDNPRKFTIWGPDGTILRTADGTGKFEISAGAAELTGTLNVTGSATAATLHAGNGANGTFTNSVTVVDGIVTGGS